MEYLKRYSGMLQDINGERAFNIIAIINTAITSGATVIRVNINSYTGPLMPKGSSILIKPRFTDSVKIAILSSDLDTGDTTIDLESFTAPFDIPANTRVFYNN